MKNTNKILLAIVIVLIIVAVIVLIIEGNKKTSVSNSATTAPTSTQDSNLPLQKSNVSFTALPVNFPANIPIEAGAKITQNYTATANGIEQSTRVFITAQSLEANLNTYKTYFQKNGWTIITTVDQPQVKIITASKGNLQANVTISQNATTQTKTVNITITTK